MFEFRGTDSITPATAFQLLGSQTRIDIIGALYEAGGWNGPGRLSYAELMDAVNLEDSGKFNYHLQKLLDIFVRKFESTYGLTQAGAEVYRAIETGVYNGTAESEIIDLEEQCPSCNSVLTLQYSNDSFSIQCAACNHRIIDLPFPIQAARTYTYPDVLDAIDSRLRQRLQPNLEGYCDHCGGETDGGLTPIDDLPFDPGSEWRVLGAWQCKVCETMIFIPVGQLLLVHPIIRGAIKNNDSEQSSRHLWEFKHAITDAGIEINDTPPISCTATFDIGNKLLTASVTEEFEIQISTGSS